MGRGVFALGKKRGKTLDGCGRSTRSGLFSKNVDGIRLCKERHMRNRLVPCAAEQNVVSGLGSVAGGALIVFPDLEALLVGADGSVAC